MHPNWNPTSYFKSHMMDELVHFWDQSDHDIARINRATTELSYAILKMLQYGRAKHALIFGSARTKPGDENFGLTVELAKGLIRRGVGVITGGGPGIMEAGNIGALEECLATGQNPARLVTGLNITLPFEQNANPAISILRQTTPGRTPPPLKGKLINFHYFFARKYVFARFGQALFCLPGGFGTMDETFEFLTLIQTGKIALRPVVFVGETFWDRFWRPMESLMMDEGLISPQDKHLVHIAKDHEAALDIFDQFYRDITSVRYFRGRQLVVLGLTKKHKITQEKIDAALQPVASICQSARLKTMVDVQELSGPEFFLVEPEDIMEQKDGHVVLKADGQIWRLQGARTRQVVAIEQFDMHSFGHLARFVMAVQAR